VSAEVYDGKALVGKIVGRTRRAADRLRREHHIEVGLGILLVTGDQVTMADSAKIASIAEQAGIKVELERVAQRNIARRFYPTLEEYAESPFIQGIYVQLPLPTEIVPLEEVMRRLPPMKDVAGLHFINRGKSTYPSREVGAVVHPPELSAVAATLRECGVRLNGGKLVIVASEATAGTAKLLAGYLYDHGSHVRLVRYSALQGVSIGQGQRALKVLEPETVPEESPVLNPEGEPVITWTNQPGWLTRSRLAPGCVVVDMGYKFARGKVSGDCDFPSVAHTARVLTPVPGGVRNIVHAMILQNLINLINTQLGSADRPEQTDLQRRFGSAASNLSRRLRGN
jgi:methylenetetrahydrofolate dehydrogenase (NADP+)/methenyltetrahydrofolate cyclohydrolase